MDMNNSDIIHDMVVFNKEGKSILTQGQDWYFIFYFSNGE